MGSYGVYDPALDYDRDGIINYKVDDDTSMTQVEYEELIDPYVPDHAHLL
jgi:hypothetical protein